MSNCFFPLVESFIQEAEDAAIDPLDVDAAADISGLMRAFGESLQTGREFVVPEYTAPIAKAGRSYDVAGDRFAKAADDGWNEVVADVVELARPTLKAVEPTELHQAVIARLQKFGVSEEEARDLLN